MSMLGLPLPVLLSSAAYLCLSAAYSVRQRSLAARPEAIDGRDTPAGDFRPSVDVIVTCFNEDVNLLESCLRSVLDQDYPTELLRVFIVDDGSSNIAELERVYGAYAARPGWLVVRAPRNQGKRLAQDTANGLGFGDLVLMVDSDTVIERDGIARLVSRFTDEEVGAVCSNIKVLNRGTNWLTKAQTHRYDLLFNQERAAQSRLGAVLCCAGPFAMFRRAALDAEVELPLSLWRDADTERATVWRHYLRQRPLPLLGRRACVSGDDLHLTHLVLLAEYRSEYEPTAVALTQVPEELGHFRRQQQRWNRSMYRELPWTLILLLRRRAPDLWLDVAGRALLPLLLVAVQLQLAGLALLGGREGAVAAGTVAGALLVGHWLGLPRQHRSPGFFLRYGAVYVGMLLPVKLYALATPLVGSWGTRLAPSPRPLALAPPLRRLARLRTARDGVGEAA